jgi:ADP-ribosyl-[dinitrogen reductase] hydrolase
LSPDLFLDRALGCMLGLAVGDAVGTTVEFMPRGAFPPVTDMSGGGPFRLKAGQWTDDTSMALCLAESLLHDPALDPLDLIQRFLRWVEEGYNSSTGRCFDIGRTTLGAICHFKRTGEAIAGSISPREAGNGSIMRLAPAAARWWRDPSTAEKVARRQSQTTHGAVEAVDSCALLSQILCGGIAGLGRAALSPSVNEAWAPNVRAVAEGSWRSKVAAEIESTGYVVHTIEAALWAVHSTRTFEAAILAGVNLGHDADTVGAVAGQIAGAIYGASSIPQRWRLRLHEGQRIEELARLLQAAGKAELAS